MRDVVILLLLLAAGGLESQRSQRDTPHTARVPLCRVNPQLLCPRRYLRLKGGSSAVWAAIDNADSESDRERLQDDTYDGARLGEMDMEDVLKDCEGKTTWEKLKNYVSALEIDHGEEEIDNIDVDEFG